MSPLPDDHLFAHAVASARAQLPQPLRVACGLGGGGEALVAAIADEMSETATPAPVSGDASVDDGRWYLLGDDGLIGDFTASISWSPNQPPPSLEGHARWMIVLSAGRENSDTLLARCLGTGSQEHLFCDLVCGRCDVSREAALVLFDRFGCATAIVPELEAMTRGRSGLSAAELCDACWGLPWMARLRQAVLEYGGTRAYDLGRVLALMRPAEIEASDEWAMLATALSGRSYSVSDIGVAIGALPGLFDVIRDGPTQCVRPTSRLAKDLMLGGIPPSTSEHYAVYRALRDRSLAVLDRRDESDRFVTRQLPLQASAAGALAELTSDALGILCSDPLVLLRELEAHPRLLRTPGGKMVALSSHRLMSSPDRASQLELSARRIGLQRFAAEISEQLPSRRWKPLWAQAELAHTHRVALSHTAPLLTVAVPHNSEGTGYVGAADGEIWKVSPYRHSTCLAASKPLDGEIRALAALRVHNSDLVAFGTSTHAIGVVDGTADTLQWIDHESHHDPLSTLEITRGHEPRLLSAGVGGQIHSHPLARGNGRGTMLYNHGSEIRGLSALCLGDAEVVAFSAVDGVVGIVSLASGALITHWHLSDEVLNAVAAVSEGAILRIVTGTSGGNVLELKVAWEDLTGTAGKEPRLDAWEVLATHRLAVNSVSLQPDDDNVVVLSCASDGSWQWNDPSGTRQAGLGHVGPVWSIDCLLTEGRRYVVTAGAEGACRLWLTEAVLSERITRVQPLAHSGPVTAIELIKGNADNFVVVTGGNDGDIRIAGPGALDGRAGLLTRHDNEISSLVCVTGDGDEKVVISGSVDGTLRSTPLSANGQGRSTVLGVAHEGVTAMSVAPDVHSQLISGGRDGTITSWNLHTGRPMKTVQGCKYGSVQALCHIDHRGEHLVVVGGQDGGLAIYQPSTLEPRGEPTVLEASVLGLRSFPGAGRGVLAGLVDGRVAVINNLGLYDTAVTYLNVSENEIRSLETLTIGGRLFVSCAGLDRHLRLLDVTNGDEAVDIELDGYSLCLSSCGTSVALGTSSGASVISYSSDILTLAL